MRRDLFDARFQLLAQGRDEQAALVDAPADLVPGVYEGGLKTWECSLDLAAYLDRDVRGLRVLEVSVDAIHKKIRCWADDDGVKVGLWDCGAYAPSLEPSFCVCQWRVSRDGDPLAGL